MIASIRCPLYHRLSVITLSARVLIPCFYTQIKMDTGSEHDWHLGSVSHAWATADHKNWFFILKPAHKEAHTETRKIRVIYIVSEGFGLE